MNRSSTLTGLAVPAAAILLAIVAAALLFGGTVVSRGADGDPSPTPPASPTNSPSADPTVRPSAPPQAGPVTVDLVNASGHDVVVVIDDKSGEVVRAVSGRPGDGMSVRWFDVEVEQVSSTSVRLTWEAFTRDERIDLSIVRDGDGYRLTLVQGLPYPNTDAMGQDLILVIDFDRAVSAADIAASIVSNSSDAD